MTIVRISFLALALLFTSCASQDTAKLCESIDWFEMGRRHGSAGVKKDKIEHPSPECKEVKPDQLAYEMGLQNGLSQYCEPKNAVSLGRMGAPASPHCPPAMQEAFDESYHKGKKILELEQQNDSINDEMNQLYRALRDPQLSPEKRSEVSSSLRSLEDRRAKNNKQISNIEKVIF